MHCEQIIGKYGSNLRGRGTVSVLETETVTTGKQQNFNYRQG